MMKATEVHYNRDTGVVTVHQGGDRKRTVTEDCTGLDLVAGDDVSVRVDAQMAHIESLSDEPLMVREQKDDDQLEILTVRRPSHEVESDKSVSTER